MSYLKNKKLVLLAVSLNLMCASVCAQEVEETWTEILYFTSSSGFAVPSDEGRFVGIWESRGIAQFEDGTVAKIISTGTMDLVRGTGTYSGYVLYKFDDSSTKFGTLDGVISEATRDGGNMQEGKLSYDGGTGRFAGIQGGGTYTARQYGPAKDGGETVVEVATRYSISE